MYTQLFLHEHIVYNIAFYNLLYLQRKCKNLIEDITNYNITSKDSIYKLNNYYIVGNYILNKVINQRRILYNFCLYYGSITDSFNEVMNELLIYISIFNNKKHEMFVLFPHVYLNTRLNYNSF